MDKITFDDYKNAVRNQFEISKIEDLTGVLLDPTPASFRDFCLMISEKGLSASDEIAFMRFFEVSEKENLRKGIEQFNTGKLKAAIEFFDQAKNTQKKTVIELCAVICNFKPRPYAQFIRLGEKNINSETVDILSKDKSHTEKKSEDDEKKKAPIQIAFIPNEGKANTSPLASEAKFEDNLPISEEWKNKRKAAHRTWEKSKKYIAIAMLVLTTAVVVKLLTKTPKCLTWNQDHYELVACEGHYPIIPFGKDLLDFKKIKVTDTTTFFKDGQPIIWYSKQNNSYDFFNADGKHPITGKDLKPMTTYLTHKRIWAK